MTTLLLTQPIIQQLPKLYSTETIKLKNKLVICRFFTSWNTWQWYVFEGEQQEDDYLLFGMVHGFEKELGYFLLSELQSIQGPLGLRVERDAAIFKTPYRVFMK